MQSVDCYYWARAACRVRRMATSVSSLRNRQSPSAGAGDGPCSLYAITGAAVACCRLPGLRDLFDRAVRLEPRGKSAFDMGDRCQTHFHRQLGA